MLALTPGWSVEEHILNAINQVNGLALTLEEIGPLPLPTTITPDEQGRNTQILIEDIPFKYRRPTLAEYCTIRRSQVGNARHTFRGNGSTYYSRFTYTILSHVGNPGNEIEHTNANSRVSETYNSVLVNIRLEVRSNSYLFDPINDTMYYYPLNYVDID